MTGVIQSSSNESNLLKFAGPYRIQTSSYNVNPTLAQPIVFSPQTIGHLIYGTQLEKPLSDASKVASSAIGMIWDQDFEALDEALWDAQFASSPDILDLLAREGHEEYLAGLADKFDPYNDPDMP